jgi:hypothetical protein
MKGIFWNIRGLGKSDRKQCITYVIATADVSFIGIQETKKRDFTQTYLAFIGIQETKKRDFTHTYLDSLAGRKQFCWD